MPDAEAQTEPTLPANVVGVEKDVLIGVRVLISFGSRAFWGTVVDCYWVSGGLFYKVCFDDGDVDILPADEVVRDVEKAKMHVNENPQHNEQNKKPIDSAAAVKEHFQPKRQHKLKRKRDEVGRISVNLWGQRLYASIYTNEKNETFIKEFLKTEDGQIGEMESTGQVNVGDMIVTVNQTRVLGMPSRDLAELIRKPKRPVNLVFFRPQQSHLPVQLQQTELKPQPPAASSGILTTTTPTTQTRYSTVLAAPPSQPPPTQTPFVSPLSFVVPRQVIAHARPVNHILARQWTQSSQRLSNQEFEKQRVSQNISAQQAAQVVGYPNEYIPATIGASQTHMCQLLGKCTYATASRVSVPGIQHARPIHQPLAAASQHAYNLTSRDQQRSVGPIHYGMVQESQTHRNVLDAVGRSLKEPTQAFQTTMMESKRNVAQHNRNTVESPDENNAPDQSGIHHYSSGLPREHSNLAATSGQSSVDSISSENTRRLMSSTPASGLTTNDIESIANLAERNPNATQRFLKTTTPTTSLLSLTDMPEYTETKDVAGAMSFVTPSTSVEKQTGQKSVSPFQAMSFLSPRNFDVDLDASSCPMELIGSVAKQLEEVKSNVSLVTVKVFRSRLYLTLGVQGTLIAVTSFVLDEFGKPGEVEMSGKVFIGDILVRINHIHILSGMMPDSVAEIVNSVPRPVNLWFKRASWEILDGKA